MGKRKEYSKIYLVEKSKKRGGKRMGSFPMDEKNSSIDKRLSF